MVRSFGKIPGKVNFLLKKKKINKPLIFDSLNQIFINRRATVHWIHIEKNSSVPQKFSVVLSILYDLTKRCKMNWTDIYKLYIYDTKIIMYNSLEFTVRRLQVWHENFQYSSINIVWLNKMITMYWTNLYKL